MTTNERIARRIRALLAVTNRQQVEDALAADPAKAASWTRVLERLSTVAEEETAVLTEVELRLLRAPWGAFAESDRALAAWRIEHVGVLARTIGIVAALPLDAPFDATAIEAALPLFPSAAAILERAEQHPLKNLEEEWRQHALWRWRCEVEWKHRHGGTVPGGGAYSAFVDERVAKMGLEPVVERDGLRDLAVDGIGVQEISQSALVALRCVHQERANALQWLDASGS